MFKRVRLSKEERLESSLMFFDHFSNSTFHFDYVLTNVGCDTAENDPLKVLKVWKLRNEENEGQLPNTCNLKCESR